MMNQTESTNRCPKCGAAVPTDAPQGLCPKCVFAGLAAPPLTGGATATAEIPSLERVAAAFPQLEVVELVGRGGMGFVFKARQPHLDRWVALKLLPDKLARDPQFAERFNREGRVLAKLNHPNIVSVFDFGQTPDFYYLLMEYVDGVNLRQAMQAGRFSPTEALTIVPKICEALQYAHEQGVLHRDIKPENILLDAKGRVKIADFGIAKLVGEVKPEVTLTGTGATLGTLHYMAPEQLETPAKVDHRADIYSLGVVFYEMLTGELPIGRFAPPSERTPVDTKVDEVVFRTLEKDRDKRFQTAGEVKQTVEHLTANGGAVLPVATPRGSQGTLISAPTKFSAKAIWGAVLTGLAWLLVGVPLALTLAGGGGLGKWELLLLILPGCLCGLAGTILGWVALSDIRAAAGRLRGLPLAVFAALACPLLLLVGVTLAVPTYMVTTAQPGLVVRALALAIPAGVLTFSIWAVYATVRWAGNRPPGRRRGVLKWVFLALAAGGIGIMALNYRPVGSTWQTAAAIPPVNNPALRLPAGMIELVALARHPANGLWWRPDGSLRPEAPFDTAGAPEPPSRGGQAVELVFRTQGLPADASGPRLIFDRGLGFSGGGHPRLQGREASDHSVYTVAFPADVRTTTVYAGIGYGPWETLAEDYRTAGSSADVPHGGERWRIAFRGALEDKVGDVVVSVNFSHSARNEFEEVRLVAVTAEGREIPALSSTKTRDHLQATFPKLPLTSIEHFRFQVRPLRWAEFKHVRLTPDNPR